MNISSLMSSTTMESMVFLSLRGRSLMPMGTIFDLSVADRMKPAPPTTSRSRKCARPARRLTRRAVLKMLTAMEQSPDSNHDPVQDFLSSGRTGRRNALPDILGEHANTSTAELPECLQKLTANDSSAGSSGAKQDSCDPSPSTPIGQDPPEEPSSNS